MMSWGTQRHTTVRLLCWTFYLRDLSHDAGVVGIRMLAGRGRRMLGWMRTSFWGSERLIWYQISRSIRFVLRRY